MFVILARPLVVERSCRVFDIECLLYESTVYEASLSLLFRLCCVVVVATGYSLFNTTVRVESLSLLNRQCNV